MGDKLTRTTGVCSAPKPTTHVKCRNTDYPRSHERRFTVPDDKVSWHVIWPEYSPPTYTSPGAIGKPWADSDVSSAEPEKHWNACVNGINRVSHTGKYELDEHRPRNPVGRTGIRGRGCLGRWGPNHAADPIVTRWKRDKDNQRVKDADTCLYVLQFVAIQRRDTGEWAIPGGMIDAGETVSETLKREFGEEALNSLEADAARKAHLKTQVEHFFRTGKEIYRGYVDDPRNTDNAWMETVAFQYHDDSGTSVGQFQLHAGDDAVGVQWMDIDRNLRLFASHVDFIRQTVEIWKAHW